MTCCVAEVTAGVDDDDGLCIDKTAGSQLNKPAKLRTHHTRMHYHAHTKQTYANKKQKDTEIKTQKYRHGYIWYPCTKCIKYQMCL